MNTTDKFNLNRFIEAQEFIFDGVKRELASGKKRSHWMWYMFPQLKGLGHSYNSIFYGISGLDEAKAYLDNETLNDRLRQLCGILVTQEGNDTRAIFGDIDATKLRSSMTLFDMAAPGDVFSEVLQKYFGGQKCGKTISALTPATDVHNLIILDESGSMMSIYQQALEGVNNTIMSIKYSDKSNADQSYTVSLVTFDSGHYSKHYDIAPARRVSPLKPHQYRPAGGTPLYDAIGRAIEELARKVKPEDAVLVTIITDGEENCSTRYNCYQIKQLVEKMKSRGWVFTYIGANQDVTAVASALSIDSSYAFESTAESTKQMFDNENRARVRYYERLREESDRSRLNNGFFDK